MLGALWYTVIQLCVLVSGDVYLHLPRGTNNRCDERIRGVRTDHRLFMSRNEPLGGYGPCPEKMLYYEDTMLPIVWTARPEW